MNRTVPPLPLRFRETYLHGGRRAIERAYGASNPVLAAWIAMAGGTALLAERAAVQTTGRKAGQRRGERGSVAAA